MDMQGSLRARLVAAATAAGARVYWVERPQGSDLPSITLQTISGDRPQTYDGFQGWRETRVQADAWGTSYGEATGIREALIAAAAVLETVNGVRFDRTEFENERDGLEQLETGPVYRAGIDLLVRHAPA
jgi:hypothetical protein